jgi:hypothetical protein
VSTRWWVRARISASAAVEFASLADTPLANRSAMVMVSPQGCKAFPSSLLPRFARSNYPLGFDNVHVIEYLELGGHLLH